MDLQIQSQVKGIVSSVLTIAIAVSAGFVSQISLLWIVIIVCGLIQVGLICIPSIEERFYREKMAHMEQQDRLDRKFEEKDKKIKLSKKLQRLQKKAEEGEKNVSPFIEHIIKMNQFRKK
ncbi:Uncharacterised protein [uncultured archaeon]|nr:Uncharacterised protein [uncultured archaeon]